MPNSPSSWQGTAELWFSSSAAEGGGRVTRHQGGATAPLKVQRAFSGAEGRCELPILHTAGGLVGGDRIRIAATLEADSRVLLTSVAAQKVYGSIGRSRRAPEGAWAEQDVTVNLAAGADLEWLPQELVLFTGGLFQQRLRVELAPGASWLGAEVVRLGRTAAGETLERGRWRSSLEIRRAPEAGRHREPARWELLDRLELGGTSLQAEHGMAGWPVFGSLVWASPAPLSPPRLAEVLWLCRQDRTDLEGEMACGALQQGLIARYRGASTSAARAWFTRLWARIRWERGLSAPEMPRVWPFQEEHLQRPGTAEPVDDLNLREWNGSA
jgi:urease accessory protein